MKKDLRISGSPLPPEARELSLRELIFSPLPHRPEGSLVIRGHQEAEIIDISLPELRQLILRLQPKLRAKGLRPGDTVLLASFSCSNELANALLFAALACMGIRIFIPIYPEVNEFAHWQAQTKFRAVIMPWRELEKEKRHEREKEVAQAFREKCRETHTECWDAYGDFDMYELLRDVQQGKPKPLDAVAFDTSLSPQDEAVIFTTSGTSGKSKLVVYRHGAFSLCCQSWQQAGMLSPQVCGNPGFTPLFTHTIGIRHFINALWTGHPVCLLVVDWFLYKPEEARYLLLRMRPEHIVGGPALFNTLLELFRHFPDLKIRLRRNLKTVISIGAPYNLATARQIKNALGLPLLNAFGTTETQMVLLNRQRVSASYDPAALGDPLPGVDLLLSETEQKGIYEMHLHAVYQSSYVLWETGHHPYFTTGDLVSHGPDGELRYAGRKGSDFIKDDFGVKLPLPALREYYPFLHEMTRHIEWLPLDHKPGMAAMLFLRPGFENYTLNELKEQVKCRNEELQSALQPFEYAHRHLERISLFREAPPLTRKGTVSGKEMQTTYAEIMSALKNPYVADGRIGSVEDAAEPDQQKYADPRLAGLLSALKLDIDFHRGEQDRLYYKNNGDETVVLDLVGGFGAGLHGHGHPALKENLQRFLDSGRPAINTQGSRYHYPSLLAKELNRLFARQTGRYFKVQLANTGSEALEIALHHAWYEWWLKLEKLRDEQLQLYGSVPGLDAATVWESNMRRAAKAPAAVIVVNNCFHGYSSGARSLLNFKKQRNYFSGLLKPVPLHIDDTQNGWQEQLELALTKQMITLHLIVRENDRYTLKQERYNMLVAALVEPVRGEGGIYETSPDLIDALAGQPFPLIADEIQCGLGRTGTLPSCGKADYYLLGKSLGGGIEKIAAVLIDDRRFKPDFPQYYTSTFANSEMAASTALRALQLIEEEDYPGQAARKGNLFRDKLLRVARAYPDIIESVQGKGLMIGIHFSPRIGKEHNFLRLLRENDLLGYLLAGWMMAEKKIRVLPSLSRPHSIRIEPSIYIGAADMDRCCEALETFCVLCTNNNVYALIRFMINGDPYLDKIVNKTKGAFPQVIESPCPGAREVGFIGNFTTPAREISVIEPALQAASETGLRILFSRLQTLLDGKPLKLIGKNLMSGRIYFTFYIVPFDTAHLEVIHRWGKKRYYVARIQDTVNKLAAEGATHISLGAHTSILSGNGLYLAEPKGVKVLTGNTLTVASCFYHAGRYFDTIIRQGQAPPTIAIAGANGNIGSGLAACFDEERFAQAKIILAGTQLRKLELLRSQLFGAERKVECTTDLFALQQADIIIACTSSNDPLVFPWHIHPEKKVFIIDVSVPGSVSEEVKKQPNVLFFREASTVYLPDDPQFLISTHTPEGKVFCCAGEVMLAALYDVQLPLKGHIRAASIREMQRLAEREGFFNNKVYAPPV